MKQPNTLVRRLIYLLRLRKIRMGVFCCFRLYTFTYFYYLWFDKWLFSRWKNIHIKIMIWRTVLELPNTLCPIPIQWCPLNVLGKSSLILYQTEYLVNYAIIWWKTRIDSEISRSCFGVKSQALDERMWRGIKWYLTLDIGHWILDFGH